MGRWEDSRHLLMGGMIVTLLSVGYIVALNRSSVGHDANQVSVGALTLGEKVIDFQLSSLEGEPHRLSDVVRRSPLTLISFQSATCLACEEELRDLLDHSATLQSSGLGTVFVSGNDLESLREWKDQSAPRVLILHDPGSEVFRNVYKLDRVPTHVVVDASGLVVYLQTGRRTRKDDEENKLLLELRHLLARHDEAGL